MLLCERVFEKNGIYTLENPLIEIVGVTGVDKDLVIDRLFLYVQMAGGLGRYNLSAQVRALTSDFVLGRSSTKPVEFSSDRTQIEERLFQFDNLLFPRSGLYEFQLIANYAEIEDGAAYLRVNLEE